MGFALVPRLFMGLAVGLGSGIGLALVLVLAGAVGPRETTATHNGSGMVHACVSFYDGGVRMGYSGAPPNCNQSEYVVELGAGDPAENLAYTVRTGIPEELTAVGGGLLATAECEAGETAISGGVDFQTASGGTIIQSEVDTAGDFPIGSPPTSWRSEYNWTSGPYPGTFAVGWVLCVS